MYKLPITVVESPEGETYLEFPDGLRLVLKGDEYVGWYPYRMTEGSHPVEGETPV